MSSSSNLSKAELIINLAPFFKKVVHLMTAKGHLLGIVVSALKARSD